MTMIKVDKDALIKEVAGALFRESISSFEAGRYGSRPLTLFECKEQASALIETLSIVTPVTIED